MPMIQMVSSRSVPEITETAREHEKVAAAIQPVRSRMKSMAASSRTRTSKRFSSNS